jgi:hypothetical protein
VRPLSFQLTTLPTIGAEQVPLRGPRGAGVRRHDADAGLDEVRPALDVLRVALADGDDDDGRRDDALVGAAAPRRVDLAGLGDVVDVRRQRERDEVRLLAGDDRAALRAAGAVRPLERDAVAGGGLLEALAEGVVRGLDDGEADDVDGLVGAGRGAGVAAAPGEADGDGGRDGERPADPAATTWTSCHRRDSLFEVSLSI